MSTSQAQIEASRRYEAKTYKRITFNLRLDDHADIIESIDEAQQHGYNKNDWIRAIFDGKESHGDLVERENVEKLLWEHRIPPQTIKAIMDALK